MFISFSAGEDADQEQGDEEFLSATDYSAYLDELDRK